MKKFFALILVLVLVALFTTPALADGEYQKSDFDINADGYVTNDDGTLPYIEASRDGGKTWSPAGIYVDDYRGRRVAFTCRDFLFPDIEQDEDMSASDWKTVEETKVLVRTIVPVGTVERDFAYCIDKNDTGVIISRTTSGNYRFEETNGEAVIWMWDQLANANSDLLVRILHQADDGNFDVNHELAVKYVTKDIMSLLPDNFIAERGLKVIDYPATAD